MFRGMSVTEKGPVPALARGLSREEKVELRKQKLREVAEKKKVEPVVERRREGEEAGAGVARIGGTNKTAALLAALARGPLPQMSAVLHAWLYLLLPVLVPKSGGTPGGHCCKHCCSCQNVHRLRATANAGCWQLRTHSMMLPTRRLLARHGQRHPPAARATPGARPDASAAAASAVADACAAAAPGPGMLALRPSEAQET